MSGKFCKAPFSNAVIDNNGKLLPCCTFIASESHKINSGHIQDFDKWWNQDLKSLRKKMIDGELDGGCRHCVRQEGTTESHRQVRNASFQRTEEDITDQFLRDKDFVYPEEIEIRMGNLCNLNCIMCGTYASHSIINEYEKHKEEYNQLGIYQDTKKHFWWEDEKTRRNVLRLVSKVNSVNFAGGEPLISPFLPTILETMSDQCTVGFNSNLTILKEKVLEMLKKFKGVRLLLSLDGIGSHNDYLRFGSKWQDISDNLQKISTLPNIKIKANFILQHTSLYTLPRVLEWADKNNHPLMFSLVYDKSVDGTGMLTINSANPNTFGKFKEWFDNSKFKQRYKEIDDWLESYKYDENLEVRFNKYTDMLDRIRKNDFNFTFKQGG